MIDFRKVPKIDECTAQILAVPVEPTEGYWTGNPSFGQRFQGSLPAVEGQAVNLIDNSKLPGPPQPWTINLFRSNKNLANEGSPAQNADVRARITYGAGGASNTFDVDVLAGTQFELVCNSLRVDLVGYNPCPSTGPYVPGPGLIIGALFGKGSAAPALSPTFTTEFFHRAEDASVDLEIPDFARSFNFHTNNTTIADFAGCLITFTTPGVAVKAIDIAEFYKELTSEAGLVLPGGVNQVTINMAANPTPDTFYALQWKLAL